MIGDWSRNHGFKELDRKIISSENYVAKVLDAWKKSPFIFDIYLVNTSRVNNAKFREKGSVNQEFVEDHMGLPIIPQEDAITLIFGGNYGVEKIPFTPWIMAHRTGHALRDGSFVRSPEFQRIVDTVTESLDDVIEMLALPDFYPYNNLYRSKNSYYDDGRERQKYKKLATLDRYYKYLSLQIGTTAAARNGKLRNHFEFIYDCVAQFIITGKVKLAPLSTRIVMGPAPFGKDYVLNIAADKPFLYEINQIVKNLERALNEYLIPEYLDSGVGKIFLM